MSVNKNISLVEFFEQLSKLIAATSNRAFAKRLAEVKLKELLKRAKDSGFKVSLPKQILSSGYLMLLNEEDFYQSSPRKIFVGVDQKSTFDEEDNTVFKFKIKPLK